MKYAIQTEDGKSLGLAIEDTRYVNNEGFRWFGMKLLLGVFAVHFVIVFLGLYLAGFYADIPGYQGLAKLILFVVPGMSLLLGGVELIFIMILAWELKTSNHLDIVLVEMYTLPEDFQDEDFERLISEVDPVEASFPVKQCMTFIEQSDKFDSVKYEYETIGLAFAGGKMTYKEFRQKGC